MADTNKMIEAMGYISLGLRLATEAIAEEKKMEGATTEQINARSRELHNQIKNMLEEDSAKDRAELSG